MHHLGSTWVTLSELWELYEWLEFTKGVTGCFLFSAWEDDDSSVLAPPDCLEECPLYILGSVSALSFRWTSLESISTTCLMVGLWWALPWVQNKATLMKRSTSPSGYAVNSGSTISRSLFSSLSFHVCNRVHISTYYKNRTKDNEKRNAQMDFWDVVERQ